MVFSLFRIKSKEMDWFAAEIKKYILLHIRMFLDHIYKVHMYCFVYIVFRIWMTLLFFC